MGSPGRFGPIVFETSAQFISTFQDLHERRHARFATHDVLDLDQLLQFVGLDLAEFDFVMNFHHAFCIPAAELEKLRAVLKAHEYHDFVVGENNLGEYVLEEIKSTWNHVSAKGKILHAGAQVRLKEYH